MTPRQLTKLCTLSACLLLPALSQAASGTSGGTIDFTGKITASTCDSTVTGDAGENKVILPEVAVSSFTGETAGRTSFDITLTGCTLTGDTGVSAYFEPDATNVDPATGHLNNTDAAAAATGVSLQLVDGTSGNAIKAGDDSQISGNSYVTPIPATDGKATIPYFVEYFKIGTDVAAGAVVGKVTYSLMYK
ncbi:hypothetical protein A6V27_16080 [Hafnia alvei]|uniref:fimbrial protein n=1 Tax=Hafnia alvei TaxID=569 RepID=UPI0007BCD8F2|nr:fimbrial protein [Hafnia alvei]ANC41779.1 hypothetical protein A6V27_16080 [Hafnia alvei]